IDTKEHLIEEPSQPISPCERTQYLDEERCNTGLERAHRFLHNLSIDHLVKHVVGNGRGKRGRWRDRGHRFGGDRGYGRNRAHPGISFQSSGQSPATKTLLYHERSLCREEPTLGTCSKVQVIPGTIKNRAATPN